ncbi:MAG: gamma-glutamyl-gamma-aminobutyrate hydrolase family protein [Smithellaceae bacterium]|nr:gamma-glutamyl-gamma-aminobutyrate hydrolase family protein [Smithellaceae bacterium]
MKAHYFKHVPFEDLGSIRSWLTKASYTITCTPFFESADLPVLQEIDLLIVMGGPMSVNDEKIHPWLVPEKKFIRQMIMSGKPVLGICLGAQLIASAMGAKVYPNSMKEIGWFPVYGIPSDDRSVFCFPQSLEAFHWHGETFDLPVGATHIAKSDGCKNQAFQLGRSVIGLQFHLETTPQSARELVVHCRNELVPAACIQTETEILSAGPAQYQSINRLMDKVLVFLTRNV